MKEYSAEQIAESILRTTEDFFTEGGEAALRVAIRVSTDFRDFLERQGEDPDPSESEYVMGTIQSGIDFFVQVGHSCYSFRGLEESWKQQDRLPVVFAEVKGAYLRHFGALCREEAGPAERLGSLLSLIRIQIAFLAYVFPWGKMPETWR